MIQGIFGTRSITLASPYAVCFSNANQTAEGAGKFSSAGCSLHISSLCCHKCCLEKYIVVFT